MHLLDNFVRGRASLPAPCPGRQEFIPFLDYDAEIRKIICSTDEMSTGVLGPGGVTREGLRSLQLPDLAARCRGQGGAPRSAALAASPNLLRPSPWSRHPMRLVLKLRWRVLPERGPGKAVFSS